MRIITGKDAGDGYRLHQWANDWITADPPGGGRPVIAKPLNVELTEDETTVMAASYMRFLNGERHCGQFWHHWELIEDGRFQARVSEPC